MRKEIAGGSSGRKRAAGRERKAGEREETPQIDSVNDCVVHTEIDRNKLDE